MSGTKDWSTPYLFTQGWLGQPAGHGTRSHMSQNNATKLKARPAGQSWILKQAWETGEHQHQHIPDTHVTLS